VNHHFIVNVSIRDLTEIRIADCVDLRVKLTQSAMKYRLMECFISAVRLH